MRKFYPVTVTITLCVEASSPEDAQDIAWDRARWELGCQDGHDWFVIVEEAAGGEKVTA